MGNIKNIICLVTGVCGSTVAQAFGGWDASLITLVTFMCVDYITGLIVAGVFHKSKKTKDGKLESAAGFKGLFKKGMVLFFVLIATRLDITLQTDYIRNAVIIGFMANELISIVENAGLMDIPLPGVVQKAVTLLTEKTETKK